MIKLAFSCFIAAIALFVNGEAFYYLSIPKLSKIFNHFGASLLLSAFALVAGYLVLSAGKHVLCDCRHYFSPVARAQRRLWFLQGVFENQHRMFILRRLQTHYHLKSTLNRLRTANNRKQSLTLSRSIEHQLRAAQSTLDEQQFHVWRRQNRDLSNRADLTGLLALQKKLDAHFGNA